MSYVKKRSLPFSLGTLLAITMIVNGAWLILTLLGFPMPYSQNSSAQSGSVWFAAITSVIGAGHMIIIKFRHKAVKSLL